MKRFIALFLALILGMGLIACSSSQTPVSEDPSASSSGESPSAGREKIKIGVSYALLNEVKMIGHELWMRAVDEFNATNTEYEVEVIFTNADNSNDKQIADIETLMASDCDVIRVDAYDIDGAVSICETVADAGIPILEVHGVKSDKIDVMGVGFDGASIGMIYAYEVQKLLIADPDLKLKIGYIQGNPAMANAMLRITGAEWLVEQYPDRVEILDVKYANFKTDEAMAVMEDWLQAYPEMNAVFSSSDDMAIGVINVLKSAGRLDDFIVTGIDGTAAAIEAVEKGEMLCTAILNQEFVQNKWLEVCVGLATGKEFDQYMNLGTEAVFGVTTANIAEAKALLERMTAK